MAALSIQVPYPVFYDRDGQPLDNGNIYIGVANLDPVTNPLQVYYDDALTITASQPLITSGGYVYRNGTPTQLYVDAVDFSITVNDSKDLFVYNFPQATGFIAYTGAQTVEYDPPFSGALTSGYTVADKLEQYVSVMDFGAVGDGIVDDTLAIQTAVNSSQNKTLFFPAGTYKLTDTIYLGGRGSIVGEGPKATIFKLTHAGVGLVTLPAVGQPTYDYTRDQTYEGFGIECNVSTTFGFEIRKALYCYFRNINIVVPQAAGANYVGFRVGGAVYLNTFVNCISDTIEETSTKHAGRAWHIGNAANAEGSIFAATNENTFITCRGIRANVGFDLDAANGCSFVGCGGESCTTAGINVRGDYNILSGCWVEDAVVAFNQYIQQDGSGGFLPAQSPAWNTVMIGRPLDGLNIVHAKHTLIIGGRVNVGTIAVTALATQFRAVEVLTTLTDNGTDSYLQYNIGADVYEIIKHGTTVVSSSTYTNGDSKIDLNGNQYIRSQRFGPLSFSSDANFKFTGTTPVLEIGKATAPGSSPADTAYLFVRDNGSGKMQLAARFPSGVIQAIVTEP
jgi:hypothetical protein